MRALFSAALMLAATTPLFAQAGPNATTRSVPASAMSEPVSFKSGNTTLNGVIENAAGNEKHSAVIIITNGNTDQTVTAKRIAKAFAAKGIVALTYDSPTHSAADAVAGIELLRQRGDVQPEKVGMVVLDGAVVTATDCAKKQNVLYTVAIDGTTKPEAFAKLSQKTLVIQPTDDAFSPKAEKFKRSVENKNKNLTLWLAPMDDVNALNSADSSLLDRVTSWALDRSA